MTTPPTSQVPAQPHPARKLSPFKFGTGCIIPLELAQTFRPPTQHSSRLVPTISHSKLQIRKAKLYSLLHTERGTEKKQQEIKKEVARELNTFQVCQRTITAIQPDKDSSTFTPKFLDTILHKGKRQERQQYLQFQDSLQKRLGQQFKRTAQVSQEASPTDRLK